MAAIYTNIEDYPELMEFRVGEVVSRNVKEFIRNTGYTTEYLSNRTNLSSATINRLKAGEHLSIRSLCVLAEVLEIDPLEYFKE